MSSIPDDDGALDVCDACGGDGETPTGSPCEHCDGNGFLMIEDLDEEEDDL